MPDEFDLENRRLCEDGSCLGVLDDEGQCNVCGSKGGTSPASYDEPAPDADDEALEDRVLCPDGACIGLLGDDGRCKECGRTLS